MTLALLMAVMAFVLDRGRDVSGSSLLAYASLRESADIYVSWPNRDEPQRVAGTLDDEILPVWPPTCDATPSRVYRHSTGHPRLRDLHYSSQWNGTPPPQ